MLSIEECRALIDGDEEYTDEQIMRIRDDLYKLAGFALESYVADKRAAGRLRRRETSDTMTAHAPKEL